MLQNGKIPLSFADVGKSCHYLVTNFNMANMSFKVIHRNKFLIKISKFTVFRTQIVF